MLKRCSICKERLALIAFNKHRRNKDGLQYFCKTCQKNNSKLYRDTGIKTGWAVGVPCTKETYDKLKAVLVTINLARVKRLVSMRLKNGRQNKYV